MIELAQTTVEIRTESSGVFALLVVLYAAALVVFLIAFAIILRKAGYSPWWVLVAFVPVLNVVMLLVFAMAEWPVRRDARSSRGSPPPPPPPPPLLPPRPVAAETERLGPPDAALGEPER
jgi:hypothetical protein